MSVWLVVGDSELRALLLAVGEEAGIPLAAIEPETVGTLLDRNERPDAMLVSQSLVPIPLDPAGLQRIDRLAIASGDLQPRDGDGINPGILLKLPASLEDVERTLRWLAGNGQVEPSLSNDSSSRLA
jgi:hypothetical protein